MKNSTAQEKWEYVLRHEFISCVCPEGKWFRPETLS